MYTRFVIIVECAALSRKVFHTFHSGADAAKTTIMQDPCAELNQMLKEMPSYTSWTVTELEKIYMRYLEIIQEMVNSEEYRKLMWLADKSPDLGDRIQEMLFERNVDRQNMQFTNIVFELNTAIEVATGAIHCNEQDWEKMVAKRLPRTG